MFKTIANAWKIPELRKKILFTVAIIFVFRLGSALPVPFLDIEMLQLYITYLTQDNPGNLISYLNILSGGAFANATIFAMGVSPYINASIIIQLLTVAIPALEKLSKEGEEGRKKIGKITRYTTIGLALVQALGFYLYMKNSSGVVMKAGNGFEEFYIAVVIILSMTAGSAMIMWLGEQINQKGIGNGISMILFAGIVSQGPQAFRSLWSMLQAGIKGEIKYFFFVPGMIILFLGIVMFIVFMNDAERRIPVQYAKRVVGRKMYGGQSTHIPIKVNMSGVLPVIFASSIMSVPGTIKLFIYGAEEKDTVWYKILNVFSEQNAFYVIVYFVLIIAFAYFYTAIQYNPTEMANNLRKNSGTIPGIRPGKPTAEFIQKIISRITLIGALFLSVIAILPIVLAAVTGENIGMSGTSILIMVGVALETVQAIESQMLMRHYKGFLE